MMREVILKDFLPAVDFQPFDRAVYNARVMQLASQPGGMAVLGGVQEDFLSLYRIRALESVDGLLPMLTGRTFLPRLLGRGAFGSDGTYFVPWMQATYLMAARADALKYLPPGADLKRLTYEQLKQWAAAIYRATGKRRLVFPVGPKGLMSRFLQGYLYPSFTGSMTEGFSGPQAVAMWRYLRELWQYVAPSSLILNRMDQALLNGEAWIAWDHSARLLQAFREQPGQLVAFPAPVGPSGRGVISVLAGLGVPRGASLSATSPQKKLIEYLTSPRVQVTMMENVGFMPVVEIGKDLELSSGMRALLQAAVAQASAPDTILSSIPPLGPDAGRSFNLAYMIAFSQIVLRGRGTEGVLAAQEKKLREIEDHDRPAVSESRGH